VLDYISLLAPTPDELPAPFSATQERELGGEKKWHICRKSPWLMGKIYGFWQIFGKKTSR